MFEAARASVVTSADLKAWFHDAVREAAADQHLQAEDATLLYVSNLLVDYARTDRLFDVDGGRRHLPVLVQLYRHALEAPTPRERRLFLQRLGDVALFVSGLFRGALRRRLVDVDYYISMGRSAYAYLFESGSDAALGPTFQELSEHFAGFVDVLAEVGRGPDGGTDRDVLSLYEEWARTGSPRAERALRRRGITPGQPALAH